MSSAGDGHDRDRDMADGRGQWVALRKRWVRGYVHVLVWEGVVGVWACASIWTWVLIVSKGRCSAPMTRSDWPGSCEDGLT